MCEGIGSPIVVVVMVVFIACVSAYMAYNVNYTKAFRMKNKIIATYEKYNGECYSDCQKEIKDYAVDIGYRPGLQGNFCDNNKDVPSSVDRTQYFSDPGYCEYKINIRKQRGTNIVDDYNHKDGYYYRIATVINIRIPIMQKMMQFNYVSGDTKDFSDKR